MTPIIASIRQRYQRLRNFAKRARFTISAFLQVQAKRMQWIFAQNILATMLLFITRHQTSEIILTDGVLDGIILRQLLWRTY